jgi:hypothetical protein
MANEREQEKDSQRAARRAEAVAEGVANAPLEPPNQQAAARDAELLPAKCYDVCRDSRISAIDELAAAAEVASSKLKDKGGDDHETNYVCSQLDLIGGIAKSVRESGLSVEEACQQFKLIALNIRARATSDAVRGEIASVFNVMGYVYTACSVRSETVRGSLEITNLAACAAKAFTQFQTELETNKTEAFFVEDAYKEVNLTATQVIESCTKGYGASKALVTLYESCAENQKIREQVELVKKQHLANIERSCELQCLFERWRGFGDALYLRKLELSLSQALFYVAKTEPIIDTLTADSEDSGKQFELWFESISRYTREAARVMKRQDPCRETQATTYFQEKIESIQESTEAVMLSVRQLRSSRSQSRYEVTKIRAWAYSTQIILNEFLCCGKEQQGLVRELLLQICALLVRIYCYLSKTETHRETRESRRAEESLQRRSRGRTMPVGDWHGFHLKVPPGATGGELSVRVFEPATSRLVEVLEPNDEGDVILESEPERELEFLLLRNNETLERVKLTSK